MRPFRRDAFCCASRTRREQSIRPKISRIDFDVTELENSQVWSGPPQPVVELGTAVDEDDERRPVREGELEAREAGGVGAARVRGRARAPEVHAALEDDADREVERRLFPAVDARAGEGVVAGPPLEAQRAVGVDLRGLVGREEVVRVVEGLVRDEDRPVAAVEEARESPRPRGRGSCAAPRGTGPPARRRRARASPSRRRRARKSGRRTSRRRRSRGRRARPPPRRPPAAAARASGGRRTSRPCRRPRRRRAATPSSSRRPRRVPRRRRSP